MLALARHAPVVFAESAGNFDNVARQGSLAVLILAVGARRRLRRVGTLRWARPDRHEQVVFVALNRRACRLRIGGVAFNVEIRRAEVPALELQRGAARSGRRGRARGSAGRHAVGAHPESIAIRVRGAEDCATEARVGGERAANARAGRLEVLVALHDLDGCVGEKGGQVLVALLDLVGRDARAARVGL